MSLDFTKVLQCDQILNMANISFHQLESYYILQKLSNYIMVCVLIHVLILNV